MKNQNQKSVKLSLRYGNKNCVCFVLFLYTVLLWHESNQYTNCVAHLEWNGLNWGQGLGHVPTIVLKSK